MTKKKASSGKIASYVAKYSNPSSGAGYRGAIEAFIRSVNKLETKDNDGKKVTHDYEALLDDYLSDKNRNHSQDVKTFSEYLIAKSKSKQSARQILTYGVKFLRSQGITVSPDFVQDLKRENKGGSATIAKPLTGEMICHALRGASVRDRAIILTLASSGLRVGELLSLDINDIELDSNPVKITIRAAKSKNKHPRFTYCSNEARDAIKAWLKNRGAYLQESAKHNKNLINLTGKVAKKNPDKVIKSAGVKTDSKLLFPVSDSQINSSWEVCLKKAGLYEKDLETERNIYRLHALRKFFYSKLSNSIMPEKLVLFFVGHLTDLGGKYYIPTDEFASAEYLKVMDTLLCCVPEQAQQTIRTLVNKSVNLEKQDKVQTESIEYLRGINQELREQMKVTSERLDKLELILEEHYKTAMDKSTPAKSLKGYKSTIE